MVEPGEAYRVEASTNLTDWGLLSSFVSTGPTNQLIDLSSTNFEHRFYRLSRDNP
jgi:hypothetical protein